MVSMRIHLARYLLELALRLRPVSSHFLSLSFLSPIRYGSHSAFRPHTRLLVLIGINSNTTFEWDSRNTGRSLPRRVEFAVFVRKQADEHSIDPASSDDRIKSTYNDVKFWIEAAVVVLNFGIATENKPQAGIAKLRTTLSQARNVLYRACIISSEVVGPLQNENLAVLSQQTNRLKWIGKGYGVTLHSGMRWLIKLAATSAFGFPTSEWRNRNWRFKLETSMVSISITWIWRKPIRAKFFSNSQPNPPAPTTRIWIQNTSIIL